MATTETRGVMAYMDENGDLHAHYPVTEADLVDGLDEAIQEGIEAAGGGASFVAICSTAAGTAAKEITVDSSFKLEAWASVRVLMANANTAASPTLNVNGTGAAAIQTVSGTAAGANMWSAGECIDFIYTGSAWLMVDGGAIALARGVLGVLGIGNGGTGLNVSPSMLVNLAATAAANVLQESPRPGVTGTLGLGNGGTGQTTAQAALRAFISACSTLTSSTIAAGDSFPLLDASDGNNAKRITLTNLLTYISNNLGAAKIQTGSYVGTGTYGADNPCSLTFNFVPQFLLVFYFEKSSFTDKEGTIETLVYDFFINPAPTSEKTPNYLGNSSYWAAVRVSWSNKKVSWYCTGTSLYPSRQMNVSGITNYYLAVG